MDLAATFAFGKKKEESWEGYAQLEVEGQCQYYPSP
jgi:hypothetical protein